MWDFAKFHLLHGESAVPKAEVEETLELFTSCDLEIGREEGYLEALSEVQRSTTVFPST